MNEILEEQCELEGQSMSLATLINILHLQTLTLYLEN